MRYQFYREHKYVSAALNDLERLIAKTDFCNASEVTSAAEAFHNLAEMLKNHATYENSQLHTLLKNKNSHLHDHAEVDHVHQDVHLFEIQAIFESITKAITEDEKISLGYKLYLTYRKFVADNLAHLHEEETILLPELQRLYSDGELKKVEAETYRIMSADEMVEMMQVLFPHMNAQDRQAFLSDIHEAQPEKFSQAWQKIASTLNAREQAKLVKQFQL